MITAKSLFEIASHDTDHNYLNFLYFSVDFVFCLIFVKYYFIIYQNFYNKILTRSLRQISKNAFFPSN